MVVEKGNYEIHITVSEKDEYVFRQWCRSTGFKPIKAVSKRGVCPRQLMFSKFKYNTYQYVLDYTLSLRRELIDLGIIVLRTKIEANIKNPIVPANEPHESNYYEFHFKPVTITDEDWDLIDRVCEDLSGTNWDVAYSFNTAKKDICPIVTVRAYRTTRKLATEIKDNVFKHFKQHGIKVNDEIQREYSVYDDNQDLDKGWIMVASDLVPLD